THPETGTKAVWFHKSKTEKVTGMTPEETQDFLQDLTDKITQPQFCYAHEYQKGDLVIIDDRASLHKAGFDFDQSQHRRLYRTLVRGDRPYWGGEEGCGPNGSLRSRAGRAGPDGRQFAADAAEGRFGSKASVELPTGRARYGLVQCNRVRHWWCTCHASEPDWTRACRRTPRIRSHT